MAGAAANLESEPPPDPGAIVRFYPNPLEVIRAYVESDFHLQLAGEHERKVKLIAEEGAEVIDPQTAPARRRAPRRRRRRIGRKSRPGSSR
jgi:hypothetical protein